MSIPNPKYVSELNELAQRCTDCAEAHRRAVERVDSARVAAFCKRRAEDHEKLAGQLHMRVDRLGEEVEEGTTLRATAEKVLTDAKSLVDDDEAAILAELVRLEGVLKERFDFFLQGNVAAETQDEIAKHYSDVADGYRALADGYQELRQVAGMAAE